MTLRPGEKSLTPTGNPNNYYTKAEVNTALAGKASTSLDNLSSTGQMIVDSINGTISNCVLEIPQNFKLEIVGGRPVVKAGSKVALTGSTYTETTIANDYTMNFQNFGESDGLIFYTISGQAYLPFSRIGSGNEQPSISGNTQGWFDTSTREMKFSTNGGSSWSNPVCSFALAAVHMNSSGQITNFLKDSNGNDMIFNGTGFIGHHAFVYPNVKALIPDGFNEDGSLKSINKTTNALSIIELPTFNSSDREIFLRQDGFVFQQMRKPDVENYEDLVKENWYIQYVRNDNKFYQYSNNVFNQSYAVSLSSFITSTTEITDFTIRQPVRTATVEMLNSALGDIETLLAAI